LVWSFRSGWTVAPIALLQLVAFSDAKVIKKFGDVPDDLSAL
jgi:hypothetical protein